MCYIQFNGMNIRIIAVSGCTTCHRSETESERCLSIFSRKPVSMIKYCVDRLMAHALLCVYSMVFVCASKSCLC